MTGTSPLEGGGGMTGTSPLEPPSKRLQCHPRQHHLAINGPAFTQPVVQTPFFSGVPAISTRWPIPACRRPVKRRRLMLQGQTAGCPHRMFVAADRSRQNQCRSARLPLR
jgi:hypothetical protein